MRWTKQWGAALRAAAVRWQTTSADDHDGDSGVVYAFVFVCLCLFFVFNWIFHSQFLVGFNSNPCVFFHLLFG